MAKVNTVLGQIDAKDLGPTLMHEHILVCNQIMRLNFPQWFVKEKFVPYVVKMIQNVKAFGVKTIVDATAANSSRDIHLLREVSEKAEINIIASTGFFSNEDPWLVHKDANFLADMLIHEFEHGISGTDSKPGLIKAASDMPGLSEHNKHLLRVNAITQKATGLPLMTHTTKHRPELAMGQQDFFEAEGVDLHRVIIGHIGDLTDVDLLEKVAKRGSYIGLDRFGIDYWLPKEERIRALMELYRRGLTDQLVVSHDCAAFYDFWDVGENLKDIFTETISRDLDKEVFQYNYVYRYIFPEVRKRGMTQDALDQIMIRTPEKILGGE